MEVEEVVLTEEEPNLSDAFSSWFSDIVLVLRNGRLDFSLSDRLLLLAASRGLDAERGRLFRSFSLIVSFTMLVLPVLRNPALQEGVSRSREVEELSSPGF